MSNMNQKAIGRRIKTARERKRLTQEQLAELIDLSPMHISVIERGVKPPKLETLVNIANVLDVSADNLLQDVVHNQEKVVSSEAFRLMSQLSKADQRRVLAALRSYVEESE
jgi:transcriptional regulator with XRE-family HTH domain